MEPARTDTFRREADREAETDLPDPGAAVAIPRVAGGAVTVSTGPRPDGYADRRVFRRGEEIVSTAVAGLQVTVDEIVGRGGDGSR